MDPARGVTIEIDGEVISDEAVVILNGDEASATVFNPNDDPDFPGDPIGPERVGHLVKAKELPGNIITGLDADSGHEQTWKVTPGRGCRGC